VAKQVKKISAIEKLRDEIRHHDELYYVGNAPEISDREYDLLMEKLQKLEEENPELITPDSPTQRVGGRPAEGFAEVVHTRQMLSLDNSYNIDELRAFDERCQRLAEGRKLEYVAELKIDGLSLSLQYEDGLLIRGVTRGDGRIGEDVTQNARTIRSVPLRLRSQAKRIDSNLEVRGEVFIPRDVFERTNAEREELGEPRYMNPRNAASGAIRQLDPRLVARRKLDMFAYDLLVNVRKPFPTHWEALDWLDAAGFRVNPHRKLCETIDEVIDFANEKEALRDDLGYEIDEGTHLGREQPRRRIDDMDRHCRLLEFREYDLEPSGLQRLGRLIEHHPRQAPALLGIMDGGVRAVGRKARRGRQTNFAAVLDEAPVRACGHDAKLNRLMRGDFDRVRRFAMCFKIIL